MSSNQAECKPTEETLFEKITDKTVKNIPIFFVDVSGSTRSILYDKPEKSSKKTLTKTSSLVTVMKYEFGLIRKVAIKCNYTKCHVICWSSRAILFKDIDPVDKKVLRDIIKKIQSIVNGTHLMSGLSLVTDDMLDSTKTTDLIIITDGEIADSKQNINSKIRELSKKNVTIKIIAVELGKNDYINTNCNVGNTLFGIIRDSNMTRIVQSFSIYNALRKEFVNFYNPTVPDGYAPYGHELMMKKSSMKKFIVFIDAELKKLHKNYEEIYDEGFLKLKQFKLNLMRFTHSLSMTIYHLIKDKSHSEQMGIIEIFCNMYLRFNQTPGNPCGQTSGNPCGQTSGNPCGQTSGNPCGQTSGNPCGQTSGNPYGGKNEKEIYFVRHGETEWNEKGLGQGSRNDIPLNNKGREQANITGKYLNEYRQKDKKFDLVLASPLIRAKETAEIICKNIKYDINKIVYMDELKEMDHGLLSIGKKYDELKKNPLYKDYFSVMDKIDSNPDKLQQNLDYIKSEKTRLPQQYEYETFEHLRKRCTKVINYLKKSSKSKILVVSHAGTIVDGLISTLFNVHFLVGDYKYGSNCHISYLIYSNKKFKLLYPPSTAHFKIYNKDYSKNN